MHKVLTELYSVPYTVLNASCPLPLCSFQVSCCSSVAQCFDSLWPPGLQHVSFPVLHSLPEFAQTHVHWVDDAIQPPHPLSPPSAPAFNFSQCQGFFQWVSSSNQVAKVWSYSFSISPSREYSGLISRLEEETKNNNKSVQFNSHQFSSRVQLFVTPQMATCQASLSITNSQSLLILTSIQSVMSSNHLILCNNTWVVSI